MTDPRIEAAAWMIGSVSYSTPGGDWEKLTPYQKEHYRKLAKIALEAADNAAWRPIESAPRDGTIVLLTDGSEVSQGCYELYSSFVRHDVSRGGDSYCAYYDEWEPTHWQPLPSPPKSPEPTP